MRGKRSGKQTKGSVFKTRIQLKYIFMWWEWRSKNNLQDSVLFPHGGSWTPSEDFCLFVFFWWQFLFEYCFVLRQKPVCIPGGLELQTTPLPSPGSGTVSTCHACFASVTISEWDQSSKCTRLTTDRGPTPRAQPTRLALEPQHPLTLPVPGAL